MDLNQMVDDVTLEKVCSFKADADSTEVKQITLKVRFKGSLLSAVFGKAMGGVVIQWVGGPGRKHFESWKHGQTVEIDFKSPGVSTIDPETAMVMKLKAMDNDEERMEYLLNLANQAK